MTQGFARVHESHQHSTFSAVTAFVVALSSPQLQVAPRIPEVRPFVNTLGLVHPVAQQIPYFAFTLAEYRRYPEPYQKDNK